MGKNCFILYKKDWGGVMPEDGKEGVVDGCFLTWVAITEKYRKKEKDSP